MMNPTSTDKLMKASLADFVNKVNKVTGYSECCACKPIKTAPNKVLCGYRRWVNVRFTY